jgi:hypothetical protein
MHAMKCHNVYGHCYYISFFLVINQFKATGIGLVLLTALEAKVAIFVPGES